jgi:signal transduction histidine kinase
LAAAFSAAWPAQAAAAAGAVAEAVAGAPVDAELRTSALVAAAIAILSALMLLRQWRRRVAAEKAERACADEAARLQSVLLAAPMALLAIERRSGSARASDRLRELLGLNRDAAVQLDDLRRILDPAGTDALALALERLALDRHPFRLTLSGATPKRRYIIAGTRTEATDIIVVTDDSAAAEAAAAAAAAIAQTARLDAMIQGLPIAVWARRPDGAIETANAAARELIGQRSEEPALAARAARLGRAQSESRAIVLAGQRRLVEFTEIPLPGGATVGFAADVTALEQLQAELARHLAAHAEVLESLGTAIVIFGPDHRLRFVNKAYARLFRFDPKWLATEPSFSEMLEVLRDRRQLPETGDFQAYKRDLLREFAGIVEPQDELIHLPDGSTLRRIIVAHPFGGVLLTYEDVTDRLALERSYNTLIEVQRETLDNLQEAVAVFGGDGRLKLSNPVFRLLWRIDPAELPADRHVGEVVELMRPLLPAAKDWADFKAGMIAEVFERTPRSGRLARPDDTIVDFANVPLPDGATLIVYVDVTDRVRVEQALRERNEALETAGRLKSEFIANVSYELRTPLNVIIGFSEILTNAYFGPLNPRQLEYTRGILESSNRLATLVNNILDLATIEAGYMRLERTEVDVAAVVEEVAALTRERAHSMSIRLETSCDAAIGSANLDSRRVKQALFNLVSNAFKFTPQGGSVTIAARRLDDALELSVRDTGIGIPLDEQRRVFEKFERGSQPGSATGLGLGLSLVRSYIELHGGTVTLASESEVGTTVTCRLPLVPPESLAG